MNDKGFLNNGRINQLSQSGDKPTEAQRGTANRYGHKRADQQLSSEMNERNVPSQGPVTVWAGHSGINAHWVPGNGWQITFDTNFTNLHTLISLLKSNNLQGRISHLGIVAHGGRSRSPRPGDIATTPRINARTIAGNSHVQHFFESLRYFLTRPGRLTFYSCIAGNGQAGTNLLIGASNLLPDRTVGGFITYGAYASGTLQAGNLTDSLIASDPGRVLRGYPRMHYSNPSAKLARNGQIVQQPDLRRMWNQLNAADPRFVQDIYNRWMAASSRMRYRVPVHGNIDRDSDYDRLHSQALAREATNNWNQPYGGERDLVRASNINSAFQYWAVHHVGE